MIDGAREWHLLPHKIVHIVSDEGLAPSYLFMMESSIVNAIVYP